MSQDSNTPNTSGRGLGKDLVVGPAADDPLVTQPEFEQLTARLSELPASLEPERDLWSGVEAGLQPRQGKRRSAWRRSAPVRHWTRQHWTQALAAALGVALGVAVTWLAMSGAQNAPGMPGSSGGDSEAVRLASAGAGVEEVESQFLRAKEELWLVAFERRDELSPEAWGVVQQNLQILDSAISNLRSALAEDPDNPNLQKRLLSNHRRSLDLLRDATSDLTDSV